MTSDKYFVQVIVAVVSLRKFPIVRLKVPKEAGEPGPVYGTWCGIPVLNLVNGMYRDQFRWLAGTVVNKDQYIE
jgi:hypothetical protein